MNDDDIISGVLGLVLGILIGVVEIMMGIAVFFILCIAGGFVVLFFHFLIKLW